jgi:hypothetical protein
MAPNSTKQAISAGILTVKAYTIGTALLERGFATNLKAQNCSSAPQTDASAIQCRVNDIRVNWHETI